MRIALYLIGGAVLTFAAIIAASGMDLTHVQIAANIAIMGVAFVAAARLIELAERANAHLAAIRLAVAGPPSKPPPDQESSVSLLPPA